ncbi:tRNA-uridine aminocarboxypropyltransferase [Marinomonas balearica]|uniref:tRNA-uridine aminocarboxypropyltransferase n=1 Tax=Marinomonas balearica TaxID=491947 RepID=A0A4R6ME38_9GAMM|nr:tRNA-uridine aminocarboxypropyltransferase [Marinomonas balearica]TDO99686.1 DTW domain-containing protein YfiP [Marinomonas balearica]
MQRSQCGQCGFVERQCVCRFIQQARVPQRVVIIQDIKESKHAKNTVGLLQLAVPQTEVVGIHVDDDVSQCFDGLTAQNTALIYPSACAEMIEPLENSDKFQIDNLVLIDATWRRAKRIWLSNPSLQRLPAFTFREAPKSVYGVRKAPSIESLSTFEASIYALEQLNGINLRHIVGFMEASLAWQWRDQPAEHKRG